jgi:hypothetical protein
MKPVTQLHLVPRLKAVEVYLHSPHHDMLLNEVRKEFYFLLEHYDIDNYFLC